jgi:signal transduction histidine kinase
MPRQYRFDFLSLAVAGLPVVLVLLASLYFLDQNSRAAVATSVDAGRVLLSHRITDQLHNHVRVAVSSIADLYENASASDTVAQEKAKDILRNIRWGQDGYFFVFHFDGTNLVFPHDTSREGKNLIALGDADGKPLVRDLIATAQSGGGSYVYKWEKPTTRKVEEKISYVVGLDKWQWMVGTGVYFSSIASSVDSLGIKATEKASRRTLHAWLSLVSIGVLSFIATALIAAALRRSKSGDRSSGENTATGN